MFRKATVTLIVLACVAVLTTATAEDKGMREFSAAGGKLILDLNAGGSVEISGTGGSSISVAYDVDCTPDCEVEFDESGEGLKIRTRFTDRTRKQNSAIEFVIQVPSQFDVELDSSGGGLSIDGVDGHFSGKTKGGALRLHDVRGVAKLKTMGGRITLTDSELDGSLETMGGQVLFENVVGDVKGSSMGGNVRYKNVQRRDGGLGSPPRTGDDLDEITPDTVQISTMGGSIEIEDARYGADLHTMGGKIEVKDASRFVRAKTMGGDIMIDSVDGWVQAVTMGGDVEVTVSGSGGDVTLSSNAGDITLYVPPGFGMNMELQIAYTRNSRKEYRIDAPGVEPASVSPDWDYDHGTPRKYIRSSGSANGGGNTVKLKTINGNITVYEGS